MPATPPPPTARPAKGILKNSSSTKKGMSITFSGKKHIKKIPHLNTMTEEDIEQIWYSHYDYDDIKASFEYTVFMMDAGEAKTVENDEHTTRGLEMRTEEGAWARFEHKRDAYNAVLDEQDRQWNDGEDDPEQIAAQCLEVTESAAKGALERGLADQDASEKLNKGLRENLKNGAAFANASGAADDVVPMTEPSRRTPSGKLKTNILNKFGG
ncbi:expressed unknown protein [Seminavis robusta]|uniref:Uncharacterized protein n=1 Tax=Seminavis robusta TaxID=568900 RepID=A0A9N8DK11_9STRA|nr:expressed unknown protein [Seminavis robusta]|eukprot:Sro125_g060290.1 n/a (212) ;mRNA; r:74000-74635